MEDGDEVTVEEFIDRFFPVGNESQLAERNRMLDAWPTARAFTDYYAEVADTDMPLAAMRRLTKSMMEVHTRVGQPVVAVVRFPMELGISGAEAATWARAFLPRRRGFGDRPAARRYLAYGRVRRVLEAGVPVEYAAALHDASSSAGVAAEDIIRLWKEGVPQEYATLAMP